MGASSGAKRATRFFKTAPSQSKSVVRSLKTFAGDLRTERRVPPVALQIFESETRLQSRFCLTERFCELLNSETPSVVSG